MPDLTWRNETRRLCDLIDWEHNPRSITEADAKRLERSLAEFGQIQTIAVDPDNVLVDGHQRAHVWAAAQKFGDDYEVDVRVASRKLTEDERQALVVALHGGASGQFDWDELAAFDFPLMQDWGLDGKLLAKWNDSAANLREMLEAEEDELPEDPGAQVDRADELREKWGVERGQVWQVGRHRVMCGDSTRAEDVARLGELPDNLVYDPPWDVDIAPENFQRVWRGVLAFADGYRASDSIKLFGAPAWVFVWDCVTSWYTPSRPLRRGKMALWFGNIADFDFDGAHYGEPLKAHEVKNTRGEYQFKPDPRGKHLSDVFQMQITELHGGDGHKHEKPVDWIRLLVGDCLRGDAYDPFTGSGTTFVACEQLGRSCIGSEIEPSNVALTLQRLCDMGLEPRLVDTAPDHS